MIGPESTGEYYDGHIEESVNKRMGLNLTSKFFDVSTTVTSRFYDNNLGTHFRREDTYPHLFPKRVIDQRVLQGMSLSTTSLSTILENNQISLNQMNDEDGNATVVSLSTEDERTITRFHANYGSDGVLFNFGLHSVSYPSPADNYNPEGDIVMNMENHEYRIMSPQKNLETIINLYNLKGPELFLESNALDDGEIAIDPLSQTPQLLLDDSLKHLGHTQDTLDKLVKLSQTQVAKKFTEMNESADAESLEDTNLQMYLSFLTTQELLHLYPSEHLESLFCLDPNSSEGLRELSFAYNSSIMRFVRDYFSDLESSRSYFTAFTRSDQDPNSFKFAYSTISPVRKDVQVTSEMHISRGERVRYDKNLFTIHETDDTTTLTVSNVFHPDKGQKFTFPTQIDSEGLSEIINTEDVASWRVGFDFAPIEYTVFTSS